MGLVGLIFWFGAASGRAHPAYLTAAQVGVEADGSFHATMRFDTLAFVLNDTSARIGNEPMEALLAGPREDLEAQLAEARDRLQHGFRVVTDTGDGLLDEVNFPGAEEVLAWRDTVKPMLPMVIPVRVKGRLPPGARTMVVRFPSVLEEVILTVERPGEEPAAEPVAAGTFSTVLPVKIETGGTSKMVSAAKPANGAGLQPQANAAKRPGAGAGKRFFYAMGTLFLLSLMGVFARRGRSDR